MTALTEMKLALLDYVRDEQLHLECTNSFHVVSSV
jgi:hypothetical protein